MLVPQEVSNSPRKQLYLNSQNNATIEESNACLVNVSGAPTPTPMNHDIYVEDVIIEPSMIGGARVES